MPPHDGINTCIVPDENNDDMENTEKQHRRKKHKKLLMGEESGLSDEQRRELRRNQRELNKQLQNGPVNEDGEDDEDEEMSRAFVLKVRKENNKLFEKVAFTREAVLDAENMEAIAAKQSKEIDEMIQVPTFDSNKFVARLKSQLTSYTPGGQSFFDWIQLGQEASVCFNSVPSRVHFLVGPLENGRVPLKKKSRTVRQKRAAVDDENAKEEEPEELAKKERKSADQLSQAERNLKHMSKLLSKKCSAVEAENVAKLEAITDPKLREHAIEHFQHYAREIDFVRFLVNPKSFTQTVENIFNFSFLVKKGQAKINMRKLQEQLAGTDGDATTNPLDLPVDGCFISDNNNEDEGGESRQCVLSFSMKDWRRLVEAYELESCDIPHRTGTKQTNRGLSLSQTCSSSQTILSQED